VRKGVSRARAADRRRWWLGGAALAAALAVGVPIAWASDLFGDVPNTNPFHDDIGAIARAGVTKGCSTTTPPNYCPGANVTREAMAAFMHRGFGRVAFGSDDTAVLTTAAVGDPPNVTDQSLFAVDITPGLPSGALTGAAGFVKADAEVRLKLTSAGSSCPCLVHLSLWSPDNADNGGFLDGAFYAEARLSATDPVATVPITGAMKVTSSGSKTVWVVGHYHGTSETFTVFSNISLTYLPFGPSGTDVGPTVATAAAAREHPKVRSRPEP
jgi:hypothetical protein